MKPHLTPKGTFLRYLPTTKVGAKKNIYKLENFNHFCLASRLAIGVF